MKRGRFSRKEKSFIEANMADMSIYELATELNRDENSVEEFIKREFGVGLSELEEASFDLKSRPYWPMLVSQFTEQELDMFDYHWSSIVSQFKDDVIHTEELQIVDMVKLDLLMNRTLSSNKSNLNQINALDGLILELRQRGTDDPADRDELFNLERQVASLRASSETLNRDYRSLQENKNKMLKEMKATRADRSKHLEDKNQTFSGWLRWLIDNPEEIKRYGVEMEKRRLAMEKERERLSKYHTYEDGQVDQPFLSSDTIIQE